MKIRVSHVIMITALFILLIIAQPGVVSAGITEFTPTNHQQARLVLGEPDFTSFVPITSQTGMKYPIGVAIDPTTGKVFVAEENTNRILRFDSVDNLTNGAAAEAVLGQADFTSDEPNRGGTVAANSLYRPCSISVDSAGRLWVADTSNHRVLRFDNASAITNGADADGVLGQTSFTVKVGGTTQSKLLFPFGVFADQYGRLWVTDEGNNRVLRFDAAATKANGADADGVLGQDDFVSNGIATSQNGMDHPVGVFVDSGGRLWVAETNNNRVLRFDNAAVKANGANADGVLGQSNFNNKVTACTQNRMGLPSGGLGGDLDGRLYVADTYNNRIVIFEQAAGLANGTNASFVLGQSDFTHCTENAGGESAASLLNPKSAFFDETAEVLWVADYTNSRVLKYGGEEFHGYLPLIRK